MKTLLVLVLALSLQLPVQAAAPFTTARFFDADVLLPTPREEFFLTPQGKVWRVVGEVSMMCPVRESLGREG